MMFGTRQSVEKKRAPIYEQMNRIASVGGQFQYLGRTMHVMAHGYMTQSGELPLMRCHYVDDHGVIREHSFGANDMDALEAKAQWMHSGEPDPGPAAGRRSDSQAVTGCGKRYTLADALRCEKSKTRCSFFRHIRPGILESVSALIIEAERDIRTGRRSDLVCRLFMNDSAFDRLRAEMQGKNGSASLSSNWFYGMGISIIHDPADPRPQVLVVADE